MGAMCAFSISGTAVVAIGRNEGERLRLSLASARATCATVVYVDSGSVDGSVELARSLGCAVHELTPDRPFSAARARNEGFAKLMEIAPESEFVQFLDGDCELDPGWLDVGKAALEANPQIGLVRGHVTEMHPEASVYNRLCNLEWQQPAGEVAACGGRFLACADAFRAAGGFRDDVIAAEDDDFCIRVRQAGWKIFMLDVPMARHDAAIHSFRGWWQRARRSGHAYAQVAALHGAGPERYFVRDRRKVWIWGFFLPLIALFLAPFTWGISLAVLLALYAAQCVHIRRGLRSRSWSAADAWVYAFFTVLSRLPGILGVLDYHRRKGRPARIIEYKRSQ
jgi:GT2 family glycosyltransferase